MDRLPARLQGALRLDSTRRERRFSDADRAAASRPTFLPIAPASSSSNTLDTSPSNESVSRQALEQHRCTAEHCAVLRTFETTELLEIILGFLNTVDVLNLRRACRKWNDVSRKSPSLHMHYFIYPQWYRHPEEFELLGLKLPGLAIELGDAVEMGRWVKIRMSARTAHRICPDAGRRRRPRARSIFEGLCGGLGSRPQQGDDAWPVRSSHKSPIDSSIKLEELLVIQPPIVGMQAHVTRSAADAALSSATLPEEQMESAACAKLYCETGINLGFLADTTASLLSSNDAASVVFKAIVSFYAPTNERRKRRPERNITYIS